MAGEKKLGLAVVGCGVVGRMRSTLAKEYPGIGWIGLSDINEDLGLKLKQIENKWVDNNFTISEKEVEKLING